MQQRLYKSRHDKVFDGVCGGIATYFNVDAVLVRVIWVLASIFLGQFIYGLFAYLIAMVIIPAQPTHRTQTFTKKTNTDQAENKAEVEILSDDTPSNESEYASQKNYDENKDNPYYNESYEDGDTPDRSSLPVLLGLILIVLGAVMILGNIFNFSIRSWFAVSREILWPILLIGIGLWLLIKKQNNR